MTENTEQNFWKQTENTQWEQHEMVQSLMCRQNKAEKGEEFAVHSLLSF